MIETSELTRYLNQFLAVDQIRDHCPNGLQVEGKSTIKKIVTGVSASQQLLDAALAADADAVIVHHGYFWKGESPVVTGIKRKRLHTLLQHEINLFAYHLPLDVHAQVGNNAQLAKSCGWEIDMTVEVDGVKNLLNIGHLKQPLTGDQFAQQLTAAMAREAIHIPADNTISTLAWCTGGAQRFIEMAIELGVDAYVSGEISEYTVHSAREAGVHYFAAGHHATERGGVRALGEHLAQQFPVTVEFIDCPNPA